MDAAASFLTLPRERQPESGNQVSHFSTRAINKATATHVASERLMTFLVEKFMGPKLTRAAGNPRVLRCSMTALL